MSNKWRCGAHISILNGFIEALHIIKNIGGNAIQIFLSNPRGKKGKKVLPYKGPELYKKFKKYINENDIMAIIHLPYVYNISKPWSKYSWWVNDMIAQIETAHNLGIQFVVLHLGHKMDLSVNEAYNNMFTLLVYVVNQIDEYNVIILLETPAGSGTQLCYKIEDFAYFYKKFSKHPNKKIRNKIKICIDTCHIFASGYNIKSKKNIRNYLETFEELIGIKNVKLIHLNDSMTNTGSRIDRHAPIGAGYIGLNGLTEFYKYFRNINVPIILETPGLSYEKEIPMLRSL